MTWLLSSRRRVVVAVLILLVILDVGRSINARIAYDHPAEVWQPDPSQYADLAWPPGADLPPDAPLGQRVYAKRCAVCHGPDGRGNGPAAPSLIPHPRDFTKGQFKYKSTPARQPPTDADLIRTVSNGLQASAMPYWRDLLSESEIQEVVAHVKSLSGVFKGPSPEPVLVPPRVHPDERSIQRGQVLYVEKGCVVCHGPKGRGGRTLRDTFGYQVISRDLTAPWTFRGGAQPEQIWMRITTGLAPSPMPAFAEQMTAGERWDVVNYVLSLARVPPWETGGNLDGPGQQQNPVKRGEYLVHAEMCGLCHTQINRTGIYRGDEYYLAGGMRVDVYPHGKLVSRNLTSDPETGLGNWTKEEIVDALQNGRARGRLLNPLDMPWHWFHAYSEEDALAIASYLKTLPPVQNRIPAPLRYGVLETVAVKLTRPAPAFAPAVLVFVDGNFGQTKEGASPDLVQQVLIGGQWLAVLGGLVVFVLAGPGDRRWSRGARGWIRTSGGIVALAIVLGGGWAVYHLPAMVGVPAEQVARGFLDRIHSPDPTSLQGPEHQAMVARGRTIFTVASCAMCHHPNGSGGLKISWKALGTLWTRNISPDIKTGIGRWSDAEISRAIRSGVTPDGRMLHWQGMIWDHASNWDEEDLRSVIAYLRTLPPVEQEIPPTRPPSPNDCDKYTFWISESWTAGCE